MVRDRAHLFGPHTVTFDCWETLLTEAGPSRRNSARAGILRAHTGADSEAAEAALHDAWREHQIRWHRREAFTGRGMTLACVRAIGVTLDSANTERLIDELESEILTHDVVAVAGSRETLETLARRGVRRALICDTGYTPGRVVRQLLARAGLLEYLEVQVFSDEVGVPKPYALTFRAALDGLGVGPRGAVHVGDLRRSDVAGARVYNMGSVRITVENDDAAVNPGPNASVIGCDEAGCNPSYDRPEADAVVADYGELRELLGFE
ncbi:MAG: HAD family hydrolase [Polyangiaceae bacterium]|jgi:putative hydrolase of the HAD superfamily